MLGDFFVQFALCGFDGVAAQIGFEDCWVNVAFAADRGSIAEATGDCLDGLHHISFRFGFGREGFEFSQKLGGEDSAGPGTEVFGGEVLISKLWADDLLEVIVDVGRVYAVASTIGVEILEEFVAGNVCTSLDDFGEAAIL